MESKIYLNSLTMKTKFSLFFRNISDRCVQWLERSRELFKDLTLHSKRSRLSRRTHFLFALNSRSLKSVKWSGHFRFYTPLDYDDWDVKEEHSKWKVSHSWNWRDLIFISFPSYSATLQTHFKPFYLTIGLSDYSRM